MRSAWWWGSEEWQRYLLEYAKSRPECLLEWKSSPLANDHDFSNMTIAYESMERKSQVLDLRTHQWSDVRKSYHSIIHRGQEQFEVREEEGLQVFQQVHQRAFGSVRSSGTYEIQNYWMQNGHAMAVSASKTNNECMAVALWIIYQGCAYFASAPSLEKNVMHAVIWKSLQLLKARGVTLVEMGQIDGETEKEQNIGKFKTGWGGEAKPFTIVRRVK